MSTRKTIAVIGATGAQGGGLVRAILADPERRFIARAITRDAQSAKARELAALGAEVVAADVDDQASLERALQGAHGAYFVTFFWDHFSPEREKAQVANMANAAKAVGLQHAVWSTLEDTRLWVPLSDPRMPTLMGSYKVPHFDAKGESNALFAAAGVPTTNLLTSFYWDNLIHFGMGPKAGPDGSLVFTLPMGEKRMACIAAEDIGKCAFGLFAAGGEFIGKTVGIAGELIGGAQMAAALTEALGRPVAYYSPTPAEYRAYGFPGSDDLGNMFQVYQEFEKEFSATRSVELSRRLNPELQDFRAWLAKNKDRIPLG